jgi:type III secretion system low calcium response chaperone LcrH/SycD
MEAKEMNMDSKEDEMMEAVAKMGEAHSKEVGKGIGKVTQNILVKGMMPKDACGVGDNTAEAMYAQGYQLYNNGKYGEARQIFSMLTVLNPLEPKYLLGQAASTHMMRELEHAAELYVRYTILSPQDPVPYYHAADCYIQLQEVDCAIVALNMVIKKSGEKPEYSSIKDRAKMMLGNLAEKAGRSDGGILEKEKPRK